MANKPLYTRFSSPVDFATATSTSFRDAIHSTPQPSRSPLQPNLYPANNDTYHSHNGSDFGSSAMSMEIGRGGRHLNANINDDLSSNMAISFAMDNSQNGLADSPPSRAYANAGQRYNMASNSAGPRRSASSKQRHLSEGVRNQRPSGSARFLPVMANTTIQSTTYSASQSFAVPDLPNLTEVFSDPQRKGFDPANTIPKQRSRFTSASFDPPGHTHRDVEVGMPDDEKAIIASLLTLKDKLSQPQSERSNLLEQVKHLINQSTSNAQHAQVSTRDSEKVEFTNGKAAAEHPTTDVMLARTLQSRLMRMEEKYEMATEKLHRCEQERAMLEIELTDAYTRHETLEKENDVLTQARDILQTKYDELNAQLRALKLDNDDIRGGDMVPNRRAASKKERSTSRISNSATPGSQESQNPPVALNVAARIAQEVRKQRRQVAAKSDADNTSVRRLSERSRHSRSQSAIARHEDPIMSVKGRRDQSAHGRDNGLTEQRQESAPARPASAPKDVSDDEQDIVMLEPLDRAVIENMRKKVELRLRKENQWQQAADPSSRVGKERDASLHRQSLPRKSSLKDLTAAEGDHTGRISLGDPSIAEMLKIAKTVRVQSPQTSNGPAREDAQNDTGNLSIASNTSRRRHHRTTSAASAGETSAFIVPDITFHGSHSLPTNLPPSTCISHDTASCTLCAPVDRPVPIPAPTPVSARTLPVDPDFTSATVRPSQPPATALATVLKQLNDEIAHLKLRREALNRRYNAHDPALGRRRRLRLRASIDALTDELERRNQQVYDLMDVLEGQQGGNSVTDKTARDGGKDGVDAVDVEDTLNSIGIDLAELSGRVGRRAPVELEDEREEGLFSGEESDELPWEGLSDLESEVEG